MYFQLQYIWRYNYMTNINITNICPSSGAINSLYTAMALSDDQVARMECLWTYAHASRPCYSLLRINDIGPSLQNVG